MLEGVGLFDVGFDRQLMELGGSYAQMYKKQAMNYLALDEEGEVEL